MTTTKLTLGGWLKCFLLLLRFFVFLFLNWIKLNKKERKNAGLTDYFWSGDVTLSWPAWFLLANHSSPWLTCSASQRQSACPLRTLRCVKSWNGLLCCHQWNVSDILNTAQMRACSAWRVLTPLAHSRPKAAFLLSLSPTADDGYNRQSNFRLKHTGSHLQPPAYILWDSQLYHGDHQSLFSVLNRGVLCQPLVYY